MEIEKTVFNLTHHEGVVDSVKDVFICVKELSNALSIVSVKSRMHDVHNFSIHSCINVFLAMVLRLPWFGDSSVL